MFKDNFVLVEFVQRKFPHINAYSQHL